MGKYARSADRDPLYAIIDELKARVKALETAAPLRNASISDGGSLVVKGVAGRTLLHVGRSDQPSYVAPTDGHKQMVFELYREDGSPVLLMIDPAPAVDGFHQFWALYSRDSNIVVGDDTTSGQGLARPYIPIPFYRYSNVSIPTESTTLGTFFTLQRSALFVKQHPRVRVSFTANTPAGTTGEVRLWDSTNGVQVGPTITIPSNTFTDFSIGPVAIGGAHMATLDLDLQARRTSGAGAVGIQVINAYGMQS